MWRARIRSLWTSTGLLFNLHGPNWTATQFEAWWAPCLDDFGPSSMQKAAIRNIDPTKRCKTSFVTFFVLGEATNADTYHTPRIRRCPRTFRTECMSQIRTITIAIRPARTLGNRGRSKENNGSNKKDWAPGPRHCVTSYRTRLSSAGRSNARDFSPPNCVARRAHPPRSMHCESSS